MPGLHPLDTTNLSSKLSWEKPERKDQAGSIVILGGVSLKLKEVDTIFKSANKAGIGNIQTLVPESLARVFKREEQLLTGLIFDNYYGLTDVGQKLLLEELAMSDGLILADIGSSSATEYKLALAISKTYKPVVITDSAINLVLHYPDEILNNEKISLVINFKNLQKIIKISDVKLTKPLLSSSSFNQITEVLSILDKHIQANIVLHDENRIIATEDNFYYSQKTNELSLEVAALLLCWQIWTPRFKLLEQLYGVGINQ
ncbi:MAG: hypothetical protein H6799_03675 [Candidatus Nomurabacteria bacterium]|nr:MAG: hypothetical protein H6799_03675 [Candidatus Nomurabacteria bacterium]HRV76077.1 hypothetical protein [Candidatus Saccharimonadales bacterium]